MSAALQNASEREKSEEEVLALHTTFHWEGRSFDVVAVCFSRKNLTLHTVNACGI